MSKAVAIVNAMTYEDFTSTFSNVIESCPLFAASVWSELPVSSVEHLVDTFYNKLDSAPDQRGLKNNLLFYLDLYLITCI